VTQAQHWDRVKAQLKEEMPPDIYATWVEPIGFAYFDRDIARVTLVTTDFMFHYWWQVTNWKPHIKQLLAAEAGVSSVNVWFRYEEEI